MRVMRGHASPEVYAGVRTRIPKISLATVYKNIHLFVESGVLREVSLHHGSLRVELAAEDHHHAVCSRCKAIFDIDESELGPMNRQERLAGFFLERHAIDIIGLCAPASGATWCGTFIGGFLGLILGTHSAFGCVEEERIMGPTVSRRFERGVMRKLAGYLAILVGSLPFLSGCNGFFVYPGSTTSSGSTTSTTSFAYVANVTTSTIAGFALASGSLVAVTGSPYALPLAPTTVVVTPANTFLYAGGLGAIYGYSIGSTGQLTALSSGSALAVATAISMDVSADGNWLFVLDANGVTIDEYAINTTTGALAVATGASFAVTGGVTLPRQVKVSPNGAYVFAAMGTGGDVVFTFNTTTGALTQTQSLAGSATTSDNALAVDASSTHLYIARSGDGTGVAAFTIGNNGALTSVTGSPFAAGATPYSVVIDATGAYLYAANRTDGTISGYAITSTGVLTALSGSPYAGGIGATAVGRDGTGKYILSAALGGSSDLTMYSFDTATAGKLDVASTSTTGTDPTGAIAIALTH